jgi:hypothetical protein
MNESERAMIRKRTSDGLSLNTAAFKIGFNGDRNMEAVAFSAS